MLTVMVHCLFETPEAFLEHLRVDIDDLDSGLSISILFPGIVENTESDITSTSSNINTSEWPFSTNFERRNKLILPESMSAERAGIVHQVVGGRYGVEHISDQRLLLIFRDIPETK